MSVEEKKAKQAAKLERRAAAEKHRIEMTVSHPERRDAEWAEQHAIEAEEYQERHKDDYTVHRWQRQSMLGGFLRTNKPGTKHYVPVITINLNECTREGTLLVGSLSNLCRFCNAKQGRMTKRARLRVANQIKQKLNPGMF